ncbi:MAG: tRNA dihydrouridine synthase DusB [Bacilli bacterium]|nr:tRNA dihydrouridine synthase DusB [Bacilli bacterium]
MWKIGNIKIKNKIVLAPMAGISNPAYIKICEEMGLGYAITELISAEAIIRNNKKTLEMLKGYDKLNIPVAIQLFGSNEEVMGKAAKIVSEKYNFKIIDINMGCPVPKVALSAEAGSALLKNPKKVEAIVKSVVNSVDIPVTVKIRSGWDYEHINAVEIAKICEKAGAKAITVHGRTRSQGYSGKADLDIIKKVKEIVKIPVIGNGDIKTKENAKHMLEYTKCDAIMIGRGALGNPWLINNIVNNEEKKPTNNDRVDMIKKHFKYLLEIKPEKTALLEMRTHAAYYLKGMPNSTKIKEKIFKTKTKEEFLKIIEEI